MSATPQQLKESLAGSALVTSRCSQRMLVTLQRMRDTQSLDAYVALTEELSEAIVEHGQATVRQCDLYLEVLDLFIRSGSR